MASSVRHSKSRRAFLKTLPTAIAAGAATPALAHAQAPAAETFGAESLAIAQRIVGVNLPAEERERARPLVARNRDHYEHIRKVQIPWETEPAFGFRPPRPPSLANQHAATGPTQTPGHRRTSGAGRARPASIEELAFEPVTTLAALLASRQISSTELTAMYLERLKRLDPKLFSVVTLTEEIALAQAAEADREIRADRYRGPLHGIPFGIKDLFAAKGVPTTWGATPYAAQVFDYDATAVSRLREAGAVLVAKLSTGELAVGDVWFRGRTRNPWSPERGSGGSSAGPASATSAGLVGFAVGTETGGSIMTPSSTCGVVGLRPTYGRISRYGCMTLRWTLDKVGPIARSVADASLVLEALHGPDGRDETVPDLPFAWRGDGDVSGLRIGYLEGEFDRPGENASAEERQQWTSRKPLYEAALELYRTAGAALIPVKLPDLPITAVYAVLNAEAGAMFDDLVRSGAINELADQGLNGRANQLRASRFIPAVEYIRAQRVRTLLLQQMNALFDTIDVFLSPSPSDSVTVTNLTGHPAIVVPAGFVDGLPIALMVTGKLWDERTVLTVANAFESGTDWHLQHPKL